MEFKEEFIKRCHQSDNVDVRKIPSAVNQALTYLETLPNEFDENYMDMQCFNKMLKSDKYCAQIIYWEEMDLRIAYLYKTMGFRGLALLKSLVSLINLDNYYAATIIIRSLLENSALLHFDTSKVKSFYERWIREDCMGKILRKETDTLFVSPELEGMLIKYSNGTTLRELTHQKPEWKIDSIGKTIKTISTEANFEKIYDSYSNLCQIAHPSIGSNEIFANRAEMKENYCHYLFSRNQNISYFLGTVVYPLNLSCKVLIEDIKELETIKLTT